MLPSGPAPVRRNANISRRYASPLMKSRPASAVREYENAVAQTASAAAQMSMRTMASPTWPRRSDPIMKGKAGNVLRIGTSAGTPIAAATRYDSAVPATIATGANAGFITKDYTPRMSALRLAITCLAVLLAQGCIAAMIPTEAEVFLEYEGPPPQQTPPPHPAAPPPPDTEIYLAPLTKTNGELTVGTPSNITNSPGYDNQPFFTPDGGAILFASARTPTPALRDNPNLPQTDIWRYDIASKGISRVTQTPENEFSPTPMLDGVRISAVTVEADGTQRLYAIAPSGPKIQRDVILPDVKPVGYHAWADDHTLALFVLGGGQGIPATLQLADTRTGAARVVATDIGRSVQRMPGAGAARHISFVQRERNGDHVRLIVKELDPATGAIATLTPVVEGSREADLAWTPDGTLLMVKDDVLYAWTRGQSAWKDVTSFARSGVRGVTRLAVSPKGDLLALVASPAR